MEKQGTMRAQASKRSLGASRRSESVRSLAGEDKRKKLVEAGEATVDDPDGGGAYNGFPGGAVATGTTKFHQLEALGPSLLEVLTLVRPPPPPSQTQRQDAGEDAGEAPHTSSLDDLSEPPLVDPKATFDLCLSRSAIVARVVDASVDNTRKVQEFFARTLENLKCEATGLVLLQESTVLVFLETTADEFLQICEHLAVPQQAVLDRATIKVLASCDDNGVRLLQGLYFRKITLTRGAADAGEWNDDSLRSVCVDAFLNVVKFVKKLAPLAPVDIRKVLTNLTNSDQMLLPPNELLLWLLTCDDVMPLDEFLELYNCPIALELESERVWPVHPLISY